MKAAKERAVDIMKELVTVDEWEKVKFRQGYIQAIYDFTDINLEVD